jgi:hypothetical protein
VRQYAISRCTPRWRTLLSVIGSPGGCFDFIFKGTGYAALLTCAG